MACQAVHLEKKKYVVRFEFLFEGVWRKDFLSNNSDGFDYYDADYIARELNERDNVRNARYEEMTWR